MTQERRSEPYNFILSRTSGLPPGSRALFLGKGHEKNAVLLAKIGIHVEVLDSSDKELLLVQKAASEANVFLITRHTRVEYWNLPHTYDVIILGELPLPSAKHTYLFEKILSTLSPNGFFVGEMWIEDTQEVNQNSHEPYRFITLYSLFANLPCKLLKINKELRDGRYLMQIVVQKT